MKTSTRLLALLASTCVVVLNGCGGGGSSPAAQSTNNAAFMSGTVAVGAPMLNVTVTIKGANGQSVSTSADASGGYSNLNVSQLTAPYRIQACGLADGLYQCYYSVVQAPGTGNVTPLTDATIALAVNSTAATVFTGAAPSSSALSNSEATLKTYLGPLLTAAGLASDSSFGTTPFVANHTGMDKVLDAIKVTSGQNNGVTFVQLEGVVGYANAYMDTSGTQSGTLNTPAILSGMSVNLGGISTIFNGLSNAIGSTSVSACTAAFSQVPIDPAFALNLNGQQQLTAANAASSLCSFAATNGFLGGQVENPALRSCDFSGTDKICMVGFDLANGTQSEEGSELAIVLRQGTSSWALLGEENPYGITVGAAMQRTLSVGVVSPQPSYTRNISIDIPTTVPAGVTAPQAAKVYIHDNSGNGTWDTSAPIATLSDSGCTGQPNLTISGNQCGGEWLSLDSFGSSNLSNGDALINALYKRGSGMRVDLYSDAAATHFMTSVYVQMHGVPSKSGDLPNLPWLNLDASSQAALATYGSTTATNTLAVTWVANPVVIPHDLTLCGDSSCNAEVHLQLPGSINVTSATMNLSGITLSASGYKRLGLYGRDRNDVGFESDYVSCVTGSACQTGG